MFSFFWRSPEPTPAEETTTSVQTLSVEQSSDKVFGKKFWMGGEEFDAVEPESSIFATMADFFYLRSTAKTLPAIKVPPTNQSDGPSSSEKPLTKALQCPVHISRDNLQLQRDSSNNFVFEFEFDATCKVTASVYVMVVESLDTKDNHVMFQSDFPLNSVDLKCGYNQTATIVLNDIDIDGLPKEQLVVNANSELIPLVLCLQTQDGEYETKLSSVFLFSLLEVNGGKYQPTINRHKIYSGEECFLIQEIFGLEGVEAEDDDEEEKDEFAQDDMVDCVICMSEPKSTLVLPCRHLCLCSDCAKVMKNQTGKCPICRIAFHSLFQIQIARNPEKGEENSERILEISGGKKIEIPLIGGKEPNVTMNKMRSVESSTSIVSGTENVFVIEADDDFDEDEHDSIKEQGQSRGNLLSTPS